MIYTQLDGALLGNLLDYGIRNLALHCDEVNAMNVFPVPDGDTGTNMVTTLSGGYRAITAPASELSEVARQFASAVVYGARGNSGVIVSQFFKGFSETFYTPDPKQTASFAEIVAALQQGIRYAYDAVSHPTEGTILTVIREATEYVSLIEPTDLTELIRQFLYQAKISLENTPNLLPILKQAGVVDSGAVGIICVFEGMLRYLMGDTIEKAADDVTDTADAFVDYSRFDKSSRFEFGYCTEFLLQLLNDRAPFDRASFVASLETLGDSIVCSLEGDKVKVHVHTYHPEQVLALAHTHGEFLSLKLENMSVQHTAQSSKAVGVVNNSPAKQTGPFAVVAVSHSQNITELFERMGADVVISLTDAQTPSAQHFVDAFDAANCDNIIVFPNNPNDVLTARQACALHGRGNVTIVSSRSIADCYAALAQIDYHCHEFNRVVSHINKVIGHIDTVRLTTAARDAVYDGTNIQKGDFLALRGSHLLAIDTSLEQLACRIITDVMANEEKDAITLFGGNGIEQRAIDTILDFIGNDYIYTEANLVSTGDAGTDLILSFE
ncbi:MAG: DAK2 domain-containing protein [Clostridia bacterium]|nr:DAK2 domain-containing protein [Clostridia bacterium]